MKKFFRHYVSFSAQVVIFGDFLLSRKANVIRAVHTGDFLPKFCHDF